MAPSKFVGVDGCPYGWFSVGFDCDGSCEIKKFKDFESLLNHYSDAELVLVDMPIGLPDGSTRRKCDEEARKKVGPRWPSVFTSPTRHAVHHVAQNPKDDRRCADRVERQHTEQKRGITNQTFHIMGKIAEVDKALFGPSRNATTKVREVHPEVCFWALNKERHLEFAKRAKKRKGLEERLRILKRVDPRSKEIFNCACKKYFRKDVARDDILDALAAVLTAYKGHTQGQLQRLPEHQDPPKDSKCLPMEMVYWKPVEQGE